MMKIYEAGTKDFINNGLGMIQPLKCIEEKRKSLNGWSIDCEVELKYSDIIQKDNVVVVDTKEKGPQPFLINAPDISNTITFTADHIIFSSERYLLDDVRPTNLIGFEFLEWINERTDTKSPFSVYSNIPSRRTKYFIRKNMLEALEETEEIFKGVYDVDNFNISLLTTVGNMSDVSLVYGKNIEGMKKWENWDTVCTKILPVGPDELMIPEKYIESDISYSTPYTRTVTFDIEKEKEDGTQKTEDEMIIELRELAINHLENNKYPRVNYTVTANVPQNLHIGDIVPVKHPIATFETDVQAYKYDHITKRVISIEYGNYERNVKKAFQNIKSEIKEVSKKSDNFLTQAKDEIYYLMNVAGKNGSVVFRKNEDGVIYEILAMDTKDIETAKTIMRLNAQGIAGTDKGINGQFNVGMMANGNIVADMIKTGTLRAIEMNINDKFIVDKYGKLKSVDGEFSGKISGVDIDGAKIRLTRDRYVDVRSGDTDKIMSYIMGQGSLSADEKKRLDFNNDGVINSIDYIIAQNILNGSINNHFIDEIFINYEKSEIICKTRHSNGQLSNEWETQIKAGGVVTGSIIAGKRYSDNDESVGFNGKYFISRGCGFLAGGYNSGGMANLQMYTGSGTFKDNSYLFNGGSGYLALGASDDMIESSGGRLYLDPKDQTTYDMFVRPRTNGKTTLGSSQNRFYRLYSRYSEDATSDRRQKKDFKEFDGRYIKLVELLMPTFYRFKEQTEEQSLQAGFIAQDVLEAMKKCSINKKEFGVVKHNTWKDKKTGEEKDEYSLVYSFFIPLLTFYINYKNKEFENRISKLEKLMEVSK